MRFLISILVISVPLLGATRGIIVAASEKYVHTLIPSVFLLREILGCHLPIEVWHSGDELSERSKERLKLLKGITFHDIAEILGGAPEEYRGYQIKGYMMGATAFDEVILMDADAFFFQNPEVMFDHLGYKETGAFLFRDAEWQKFGDPHPSHPWYHKGKASFYLERREYILSHIDTPSEYVPDDWLHYWRPDFIPHANNKVTSEHVETGCVIMDRVRHKKAIEYIVAFNDDRETFFRLFLGEKETFWLGLEKAKEPYTINSSVCYSYYTDLKHIGRRHDLVHFVDSNLFFLQKAPEFPPVTPLLIYNSIDVHPDTLENLGSYGFTPAPDVIEQFQTLTFWFHVFSRSL